MTPQQFLNQLRQGGPAPAYLFIGPEAYQRDFCRKALVEHLFPEEAERAEGVSRHDLRDESLSDVLDDARSPSLFSPMRLIVVASAEEALPKGRASAAKEEAAASDAEQLAGYMRAPSPGVTLVFEAARYEFQGEDKKKIEAVKKFYAPVAAQVEMQDLTPQQAKSLAQKQAQRIGLNIGPTELDMVVEALGYNAARIALELDKLRIYAGEKRITAKDVSEMIPEARETTIFALVDALARGDRPRSLELLDTLVRQSEYLPLALSFLATQFRLALAASEAGLRSPQQIMSHFAKSGVPMWPSRADQVYQTVRAFPKDRLAGAIEKTFGADRALRDTRPDDRVVMEEFILQLTA